VGINIGDVIVEPHDIFGDGVNIAARLEGIAEPGGICISSAAYEQVRGKVEVEFADLGEQTLKNIARPVRAYAVGLNANYPDRAVSPLSSAPHLSLVVLPFANIGGDPEQEYFVDGVTESLTTDLSRISGAFVIARIGEPRYDFVLHVEEVGNTACLGHVTWGYPLVEPSLALENQIHCVRMRQLFRSPSLSRDEFGV
jgi:hypothetical protein